MERVFQAFTAVAATAEAASRFRALQTMHLDPPAMIDDWAVLLLPEGEREALRGDAGRAELAARRGSFAIRRRPGSAVQLHCRRGVDDQSASSRSTSSAVTDHEAWAGSVTGPSKRTNV